MVISSCRASSSPLMPEYYSSFTRIYYSWASSWRCLPDNSPSARYRAPRYSSTLARSPSRPAFSSLNFIIDRIHRTMCLTPKDTLETLSKVHSRFYSILLRALATACGVGAMALRRVIREGSERTFLMLSQDSTYPSRMSMFSRVKRMRGWGLGLLRSSESSERLRVSMESLASCRMGSALAILAYTSLTISSI